MKNTLSVSNIADALLSDQYASWSYEGAQVLAEYLDNLDQEMETDTELDVCAIRCDFNEYNSALDAAKANGFEVDEDDGYLDSEDEQEEKALEYLQQYTTVIKFNGGVIIQNY
jgi:hypothetical protein